MDGDFLQRMEEMVTAGVGLKTVKNCQRMEETIVDCVRGLVLNRPVSVKQRQTNGSGVSAESESEGQSTKVESDEEQRERSVHVLHRALLGRRVDVEK